MPDPNGDDPTDDLVGILTARAVGDDRFAAPTVDWFGDRVFGGVAVAQALSAAMATVGDGFRPHSLHGYFLGAITPGPPVDLRVERLRDGRTFTTRHVVTRQHERAAFWATCSFHADENGDEYQLTADLDGVPPPDDVPPEPDHPGPMDVREIGPTPLRADGTRRSTRRAWFRALEAPEDPDAHTIVAAYLSDMTGTSFRPHSLGEWGTHTDASIDHAVWFHRPVRLDDWVYADFHALVNTGGRSVVRGAMYNLDGQLCLSMAQELLIRPVA
jgi:acyl-CoA thioesterase II